MHLKNINVLVTAGTTHEPIDPVRYIANRSSGKQGYAIADALAKAGADVTLVSGPTHLPALDNVTMVNVQTARNMFDACTTALPVDIAVMAAAVVDWAPAYSDKKIKKDDLDGSPTLMCKENPDILQTISLHPMRPRLVVGFAAETNDLILNAKRKLNKKGCDWIVANDVSENVFGADQNHVYLITQTDTTEWPRMDKTEIAQRLVAKIEEFMNYA